ncbi:MAG TPA: Xaa-Pro peptidase family protein [Ktedonobacterales bacterium]|nr:Xaa-Pro peptidase family protein [Ktedonobacterales bacterium]
MDTTIQREKLEQATGILDEQAIDCWLTFVRETSETPDPALKLILGFDVTWHSALLVTRTGKRIAVVGRGDGELLRSAGLYETVLTYDENITPVLRTLLRELDPQQIAVNYALGDVASDGLTHGMYLQLASALRRTPYLRRLISAAPVIGPLRSRKTATELARMRRALEITLELFTEVTAFLRPGRTEREVADLLHGGVRRRALETSWEWDYCPIVDAGAASGGGHSAPTDSVMHEGDLVHLDFGVAYEDYRADLQRMWYLRSAEEPEPPESVRQAFLACTGAIEAARDVLRAGVPGWEVDATARQYLVEAGYPEYKHALGHSVGLATHDGGPLIGPRWPRYGETPERPIEPGSVYTLELGTQTERGYIGLEDEVLVTVECANYLAPPQRELIYVG